MPTNKFRKRSTNLIRLLTLLISISLALVVLGIVATLQLEADFKDSDDIAPPSRAKLFFYASGLPLFTALVFAAELGLYYAGYHQSWILAALSLGAFIAWVNMLIIWLDCELIWKSPVTRCPTYDTSIWHPLWVWSLNIWIARFGLGCLIAILHVACMILPFVVRAGQSGQADVVRGELIECTEDQTTPTIKNGFEGARMKKGLAASAK